MNSASTTGCGPGWGAEIIVSSGTTPGLGNPFAPISVPAPNEAFISVSYVSKSSPNFSISCSLVVCGSCFCFSPPLSPIITTVVCCCGIALGGGYGEYGGNGAVGIGCGRGGCWGRNRKDITAG